MKHLENQNSLAGDACKKRGKLSSMLRKQQPYPRCFVVLKKATHLS